MPRSFQYQTFRVDTSECLAVSRPRAVTESDQRLAEKPCKGFRELVVAMLGSLNSKLGTYEFPTFRTSRIKTNSPWQLGSIRCELARDPSTVDARLSSN